MTKMLPLPVVLPLVVLALIPSLLHAMPAKLQQAGKAHLGIWQLKTRGQSLVTPLRGTSSLRVLPQQGIQTAYALDRQSEIQLNVESHAGSPESVTLSNALGFEHRMPQSQPYLTFRVRAECAGNLPLTLQESGRVFWSAKVQTSAEWQEIRLPLTFKGCTTNQAILTLQLGEIPGQISVADVRIETE